LNCSTGISIGIVLSVTGILSGKNNGIEIHILNVVASDLDNISYKTSVEIGLKNCLYDRQIIVLL